MAPRPYEWNPEDEFDFQPNPPDWVPPDLVFPDLPPFPPPYDLPPPYPWFPPIPSFPPPNQCSAFAGLFNDLILRVAEHRATKGLNPMFPPYSPLNPLYCSPQGMYTLMWWLTFMWNLHFPCGDTGTGTQEIQLTLDETSQRHECWAKAPYYPPYTYLRTAEADLILTKSWSWGNRMLVAGRWDSDSVNGAAVGGSSKIYATITTSDGSESRQDIELVMPADDTWYLFDIGIDDDAETFSINRNGSLFTSGSLNDGSFSAGLYLEFHIHAEARNNNEIAPIPERTQYLWTDAYVHGEDADLTVDETSPSTDTDTTTLSDAYTPVLEASTDKNSSDTSIYYPSPLTVEVPADAAVNSEDLIRPPSVGDANSLEAVQRWLYAARAVIDSHLW